MDVDREVEGGNGVLGELCLGRGAVSWYMHVNFFFPLCFRFWIDRSVLRRRRRSSRSRSGSVSLHMDEDRDGEDSMEVGEVSARMPPKMRKAWIRKAVAVVNNKKDTGEGPAKGKGKEEEVSRMEVDMEGALTWSLEAGTQADEIFQGPISSSSTSSSMAPPPVPNSNTIGASMPSPSLSPAYKPRRATHLHPSERRSSDSYAIFAPSTVTAESEFTIHGPPNAPASAKATPSPTADFAMLSLTSPQVSWQFDDTCSDCNGVATADAVFYQIATTNSILQQIIVVFLYGRLFTTFR